MRGYSIKKNLLFLSLLQSSHTRAHLYPPPLFRYKEQKCKHHAMDGSCIKQEGSLKKRHVTCSNPMADNSVLLLNGDRASAFRSSFH